MGQSQPFQSAEEDAREAFRTAVLEGAGRLSREQIRSLADELHELARTMTGPAEDRSFLSDDGRAIWL